MRIYFCALTLLVAYGVTCSELEAQTPSEIVALRLGEYTQTSATNLRFDHYDFALHVGFATTPATSTTVTLRRSGGSSTNLVRQSDGTYQLVAQFPTIAQLAAAYPDGSYSIAVSGGGAASTSTFNVNTGSPIDPVLITNFDSLQATPLPQPEVIWPVIPGADTNSVLSFTAATPDGTDLPVRDLSPFDGNVSFGPLPYGVTITADLTYAKIGSIAQLNNGATNFGSGAGFNVEFPILYSFPAPTFITQPQGGVVTAGAAFGLSGLVTSPPVLSNSSVSYQWFKDGVAVPGATNRFLTLPSAKPSDAGTYTLVATTSAGSTTSTPAVVAVGPGLQVTTYAGSLTAGTADGPAASAKFDRLTWLTLDSAGNLYALDSAGTVIRKITPAGVVSTLAGSPGLTGSVDGVGAAARFNGPKAIAVDRNGNLYVADTGNVVIRKITPDGTVTTFAGAAGQHGYLDGQGVAARFNQPTGVAVDASGNVFVSEDTNRKIRKITPAGLVSTFAGSLGPSLDSIDGTGTGAAFASPNSIVFAPDGNLYVNDRTVLRKITPGGVVTTVPNVVLYPLCFAVDATGAVYLYDGGSKTITLRPQVGGSFVVAGGTQGSTADGFGNQVGLSSVQGMVLNPATNTLYFTDGTRIRQATLVAGGGFGSIAFTLQPQPLVVATGSTLVLSARTSGLVTGFGWRKDGVPISGASGYMLSISNVQPSDAGTYTFVASNPSGVATSTPAVVTVVNSPNPGRITNLSIRSNAGAGAQTLIVGLAVGGTGSGTKSVLIRGVGPTLGAFGVSGALADPVLNLFSGSTLIGNNDDWAPTLSGAFSSVGAFALPSGSADAALSLPLARGAYSALVIGKSGSGLALAEIYDLDQTPGGLRLVNVSARTQVGVGANVLIAGFVIGGETAKTLLLRATGPTLTQYGVSQADVLPDPQLELYAGSTLLASNDDFEGFEVQRSVMQAVGAFPLISLKDSVIVLTLPPGVYSAKVSGVGNTTGVALVEVYEVP